MTSVTSGGLVLTRRFRWLSPDFPHEGRIGYQFSVENLVLTSESRIIGSSFGKITFLRSDGRFICV